MHFEDVLSLTPDETDFLRINGKNDGKRYSEVLMNKVLMKNCHAEYSKTAMDFKKHYLPRMQAAIDHAESFCVNLGKLEYGIGSNMGRLLTEILNNRP